MLRSELEFLRHHAEALAERLSMLLGDATEDAETPRDGRDPIAIARATLISVARVDGSDVTSPIIEGARDIERAFDLEDCATLPIIELAQRYEFDATDADLLLFVVAFRLQPQLAGLLPLLTPPRVMLHPTPLAWLRHRALDDPDDYWREQHRFDPHRPLFRSRLLSMRPTPDGLHDPLTFELVVSDGLLALLRGEPQASLEASTWMRRHDVLDAVLDEIEPVLPRAVHARLGTLVRGHLIEQAEGRAAESATLILISGGAGVGKTLAVRACCRAMGLVLREIDAAALAACWSEDRAALSEHVERLVHEASWFDEAMLFDDADELLKEKSGAAEGLRDAMSHCEGLIFVSMRSPGSLSPLLRDRLSAEVHVPPPRLEQAEAIWAQQFDRQGIAGIDPMTAAERFPLDGRQISTASRLAWLLSAPDTEETTEDGEVEVSLETLRSAVLDQLKHGTTGLGIVETTASLTLDDLVIESEVLDQLRAICTSFANRNALFEGWRFGERIRRGRGLICLFDGEPGTGKTMCADVLANELGLMLVRVNTGQIIDKYIGETEKKLAAIFSRAHPGMQLLLFDEADSLFGRRTKVERSSDRYANAAINVLLQLVESYEGLVVLTTNLKQGIDPAFERRFSFRVRFPTPGVEQRAAIWRGFIPAEALQDEPLDYELLAKELELAGGGIKNAVLRGAYKALQQGCGLTTDILLDAGYLELSSGGKLVRDWGEG